MIGMFEHASEKEKNKIKKKKSRTTMKKLMVAFMCGPCN